MNAKILSLSLALAACSGITTQVRTTPGANLMAYHTFAWAPPEPGRVDTPGHQAIRTSLEQNLAQRGIVAGQPPDFLIAYHTRQRQRTEVYPTGFYGGYYGYYGGYGYPDVRQYTEGTLIIDFIDPRTHEVFWRGTASAALSHPDNPDPNQLAKAVSKLLAKYPSQVAGAGRTHL